MNDERRCLVIDAQPAIRLGVRGLLSERYEVEEAESGAAGLQKLRRKPFDLLILDSELDSEDGWDVLREVRSDASLSDVKVIVFMAPKGETEKLLLVPVDAELRRPFSLGALLEAVERVIGAA